MVWADSLLVPSTGERVWLFVPRMLHPVRLRSRRANQHISKRDGHYYVRAGDWYWWDQLRERVIPYQHQPNDEWPLEYHRRGESVTGFCGDDLVVAERGLTGQLRCQEWPGFRVVKQRRKRPSKKVVLQLRGDVSPAVRQLVAQLSATSTGPTDPSHVTPPIAVVKRVSSTRSSKMTSVLKASSIEQAKYLNVPPKGSPEIAAIMSEQGVNRKQAYEIARKTRLESIEVTEIPKTQRVQVLAALAEHGGQSKNAPLLLQTLHDDGVSIDMHDTVKTLWALSKTHFVSFRERRNPPELYAIKLTDKGFQAYADLKASIRKEERRRDAAVEKVAAEYPLPKAEISAEDAAWMNAPMGPITETAKTVEEVGPAALETFRRAQAIQEAVNDLGAGPDRKAAVAKAWHDTTLEGKEPVITLDALSGPLPNIDLTSLPLTRAIRDRARREAILAQAAALLEAAEQDDIAVLVLEQTKYSDLELEVKNLLAALGEI